MQDGRREQNIYYWLCNLLDQMYRRWKKLWFCLMHTDWRTDRKSSFNNNSAGVHPRLKSFDWFGSLWMPNQLLCPQQSRNVQTPSHNISSNCLTRFVNMTWLFHNQGENSSEGLRLGFVLSPLFTFLSEKCVFLKLPRWLRLFPPAT